MSNKMVAFAPFNMTRISAKRLIRLVHIKPALWDPMHDDYNNKVVLKQLWREIGDKMKTSAERCKVKWRNLRDVFRRELKKYQSRLNDPNKTDKRTPRWYYFKELQFLTEHLSGIESASEFTQDSDLSKDCFYVKCEPELLEEYDYDEEGSDGDTGDEVLVNLTDNSLQNTSIDDNNKNHVVELFNKSEIQLEIVDDSESSKQSVGGTYYNDKIKGVYGTNNEDDSDYHFLMSLLPFLTVIPQHRKMLVRTKIQNIFLEEMEAENNSS